MGLCPTLGVEWGSAPLWGGPTSGVGMRACTNNPRNPTHPAPNCLRATDPVRGEGRDGEPPPRGAPWGALATSGAALAAHEVARARKELPARRLADTLGLRARCVGQAAWHPATATQRWLARRLLQKPPFIASGLPRALPAPTALGRCVSVVWAWVSDDIKGFSRGNMAFSFTP